MQMYPLNAVWFGYLLFIALVGVCVHYAVRRRPVKVKKGALLALAILDWALSTSYSFKLVLDPDIYFPLSQNLPLHLCTLCTFGLIPATIFDWRPLRTFCFFPGMLGAFLALLSPAATYTGFPLFSLESLGFFGVHSLNVMIPILLTTLGLYTPSYREALKSMGYFLIVAAAIIPVNLVLREVWDPKTNYFYMFDPEGAGILVMLWDLVHVPIIYAGPVLPLALGVFMVQAAAARGLTHLHRRLAGQAPAAAPPDPGPEAPPAA